MGPLSPLISSTNFISFACDLHITVPKDKLSLNMLRVWASQKGVTMNTMWHGTLPTSSRVLSKSFNNISKRPLHIYPKKQIQHKVEIEDSNCTSSVLLEHE
jgi:hypothetical protein